MANKIQVRRGKESALPTLAAGEPALTTDTEKVYIGTGSRNICINENQEAPVQSVNGKTGAVTVTKNDVGLGNVPNVATNDQTPTYTEASSLTALTSGEKLSLSLGKMKKAVSSLISHVSGGVVNIGNASSYGHVKVINDLTQSSNLSGTALSAYQGKVLKDMIDAIGFPSKPALTAVCPAGTVVGTSAWTGTGEMNTDASENNSHDVFHYELNDTGINHMRFCLKLSNVAEWQDWTPYYDYNGTTYEFFYSETRQLYEGVIPYEGLTPQAVTNKVRWVYKRRPDIIVYGDVGLIARQVKAPGATSTTFVLVHNPSIFRQLGNYVYEDNAPSANKAIEEVIRSYQSTDVEVIQGVYNEKFDLNPIPAPLRVKFLLASDTKCQNTVAFSNVMEIIQISCGTKTFLTIDTIDNWGA